MNNLISTCYVIVSPGFGPQPTIYLTRPEFIKGIVVEIKEFSNPFEAKSYLRKCVGEKSQIEVVLNFERAI